MNVFLATTSLASAYGGPAVSVAGLATALGKAGVRVGLWASDNSAVSACVGSDPENLDPLGGDATDALSAFGSVDVLHDNGLWLPHNHWLATLAIRRHIPRVVSTRGMLEPWAMRHKGAKKKLAWWLYQRRDLRSAQLLHTTAAQEAATVQQYDLGVPIVTIPNGVDLPPSERRETAQPRPWRHVPFLGRIYPVKGLPMLVRAWARVRPSGWRLQIAGPDEGGHRAEVERIVAAEGVGDTVKFLGPLEGQAKKAALQEAELLVLPSHSESFGMVVAEALAYGLPVLTTTPTPWQKLIERDCGWWVEPTVEGIAEGLRAAARQDVATLASMGARGRDWVAAEFSWKAVANQFLAAYESILS